MERSFQKPSPEGLQQEGFTFVQEGLTL